MAGLLQTFSLGLMILAAFTRILVHQEYLLSVKESLIIFLYEDQVSNKYWTQEQKFFPPLIFLTYSDNNKVALDIPTNAE